MGSVSYVKYGAKDGSIGKMKIYRTDGPFKESPAYMVEYCYGLNIKGDPIKSTAYHVHTSDYIAITKEEYESVANVRMDTKKQKEAYLRIRARLEEVSLAQLKREKKFIDSIPEGKCKSLNCDSSTRTPPCALCYD